MLFVETSIFTRRITSLVSAESYRRLQLSVAADPEVGRLIRGGGGLRKLRWSAAGRGKRGGIRVVYYWHQGRNTALMLFAFAKNERSDLSKDQLKALRTIIESEYHES